LSNIAYEVLLAIIENLAPANFENIPKLFGMSHRIHRTYTQSMKI